MLRSSGEKEIGVCKCCAERYSSWLCFILRHNYHSYNLSIAFKLSIVIVSQTHLYGGENVILGGGNRLKFNFLQKI